MFAEKLIDFINKSPSPFHVTENLGNSFEEAGFTRLNEWDEWKLEGGRGYYVTRNDSAIIAFTLPSRTPVNFKMVATHNDSPCFKVKENPEMVADGHYIILNTEKYGGMIMSTWLDRPLSVAGRVVYEGEGGIECRLVNMDRDTLIIPNLAIHMNREINDGYKYNPQKDMLPLYSMGNEKGTFIDAIAKECGIDRENVLSYDLFVYNREKGSVWGGNNEFLSAPRLDDLQCTFLSAKALEDAKDSDSICMSIVFDNEETGSSGCVGADSDFLRTVLDRIRITLQMDMETYYRMLAGSYMISADNAHGVHPNHPDKADPTNRPYINGGIVIKSNAAKKYSTDALTEGIFKKLCKDAGVSYQTYVNRSDIAGGSTLGNISSAQVSVPTIDIGIAELAMHSAYETSGVRDTNDLYKIFSSFFNKTLHKN